MLIAPVRITLLPQGSKLGIPSDSQGNENGKCMLGKKT
jgi:hypothetical protein